MSPGTALEENVPLYAPAGFILTVITGHTPGTYCSCLLTCLRSLPGLRALGWRDGTAYPSDTWLAFRQPQSNEPRKLDCPSGCPHLMSEGDCAYLGLRRK